jgi:ABC-type transport system substrate-binding protein
MSLTIKSNSIPRDILNHWELTDKEKQEFDYIDFKDENCSATFFRYKGNVYDIGEFMRIERHPDSEFMKWDGYSSDSYFSGIVIKYVNDNEQIIVGSYFS